MSLSSIEIRFLLKLYIKNRNIFYLKEGNLNNFNVFISWYLNRHCYEKYIPYDNKNKPWYIGNYELQTLAGIFHISVPELYMYIKELE